MDANSNDSNDNEGNVDSSVPQEDKVSNEGSPVTNSVIKCQFDKIFSEVQRNLPSIDFDSSDISSDNDEPIFFHQNLKLGEFSSCFDDDKDLDTSKNEGEKAPCSKIDMVLLDSNTNQSSQKGETDHTSYDNDLAVLMSQATYPNSDEITSWRTMAGAMEATLREEELRDKTELSKSSQTGHLTRASAVETSTQNESVKKIADTMEASLKEDELRDNINSLSIMLEQLTRSSSVGIGTSPLPESRERSIGVSAKGNEEININQQESEINDHQTRSSIAKKTEERFSKRLQESLKKMDKSERRSYLSEVGRIKDEEIVSKFTPGVPTTLSMGLFEEVDLDSIMETANEEQIPLSSLRVIGRPTADQVPDTNAGSDANSQSDQGDDITLIQKLAQLSMVQNGMDLENGLQEVRKSFDPHTGALLNEIQERILNTQVAHGNSATEQPKFIVEDTTKKDFGQGTATTTSCVGTNTLSGSGVGKILYGRFRPEKKVKERETVYIDLRGFEKQKEEEKQGLESIQRVLGLQSKDSKDTFWIWNRVPAGS